MNSRSLFRVYSRRDFSGRTPLPPGSRAARDERSECGATASTTNHRKTTSHRDFSGRTPLPPGSRAARDERSECGATASTTNHRKTTSHRDFSGRTPLPPGSRAARDERSECGATASTTNHRKPLPTGIFRAVRHSRPEVATHGMSEANAAQLQHPNAGYFPQAPSTTPLPHPEVTTKFVHHAQNPHASGTDAPGKQCGGTTAKLPEAPATQADSIKRRLRIITGPPFAVSHDPTE